MKKAEKHSENLQVNNMERKNGIKKRAKSAVVTDEDIIRARAEEIYLRRLENGVDGTPENDWFAAIESIMNSQNQKYGNANTAPGSD